MINKLFLKALFLSPVFTSPIALAEPVLFVQLEMNDDGVKLIDQQVRDIAYKPSRSAQKQAAAGQPQQAEARWVAQVLRLDGSVEREIPLADPRDIRGEFYQYKAGARADDEHNEDEHNEAVFTTQTSGRFEVKIPVSSRGATLRIVERQFGTAAHQHNADISTTTTDIKASTDEVKGEFSLDTKE